MSHTKATDHSVSKPTTKESLFSIGEHFYALESLIIDNEGEIDDTIDHWLEEYQAKEHDKVDAYCYLIQKFEDISAEAKRLAQRSTSYNRKAKQLKDRLKYYLEKQGREKVETQRFTVSVTTNGGQLPLRIYDDITPEKLPDQFVRIYREVDATALRDAIINGDEEAMRFAQVLPRGTHLRIK